MRRYQPLDFFFIEIYDMDYRLVDKCEKNILFILFYILIYFNVDYFIKMANVKKKIYVYKVTH